MWLQGDIEPEQAALAYIDVNKGVADSKAALDGARAIIMERIAEDANLLAKIRHYLTCHAEIVAQVVAGKEQAGEKFKDYFDHRELISKTPSHRALAMLRGRNEGFLTLSLNADPQQDESLRHSYCETLIAEHYQLHLSQAAADQWRQQVISWAWRIKVSMHMETELMAAMKERAEIEAIDVFANNLKDLLMAAPAGLVQRWGSIRGCGRAVKSPSSMQPQSTRHRHHLSTCTTKSIRASDANRRSIGQ